VRPTQIVLLGVLAVVWPCTLYKLSDLARRPHSRALRALAVTLVTISVALTMQPLVHHIDRWAGVVGFTRVTSNGIVLVSATASQAFVLYLTGVTPAHVRSVRWRVAGCAAAVLAIAFAFVFLSPPAPGIDDPQVTSGAYYQETTTYAAGWVYVYIVVLGVASFDTGRLTWQYARIADRPLMRAGLRTMTLAAGLSVAYCVLRLAYLSEPMLGIDVPGDVRITMYFYSACILLVLIGTTMPSWGPLIGLDAVVRRTALRRSVRRLLPLWQSLKVTNPGVLLAAADQLPVRLRHTRLIAEISDLVRMIRPLAGPGTAAAAAAHIDAAGLTGLNRDATVEAVVVAVAVHRHTEITERAQRAASRAGLHGEAAREFVRAVVEDAVEQATAHQPDDTRPAPSAGYGPVDFLEQVSAAFHRSPLVPAVAAELTTRPRMKEAA
jgi:hypothetical protein